jgi:hypothetical protein
MWMSLEGQMMLKLGLGCGVLMWSSRYSHEPDTVFWNRKNNAKVRSKWPNLERDKRFSPRIFTKKFSERLRNGPSVSADGCRRPILPIHDLWLVLWFWIGTYHIQGCRNDLEQSRALKLPIYGSWSALCGWAADREVVSGSENLRALNRLARCSPYLEYGAFFDTRRVRNRFPWSRIA